MLLEALLIFSCLVAGFGFGCIYCGVHKTKAGTPSASHNKPRNAISKGNCRFCVHRPGDDSWSLTCKAPQRCMQGEMWKPLETASVG